MRLPPAFVPIFIVGDGRQEAAVGWDDIDGSLEGVLVGDELGDEDGSDVGALVGDAEGNEEGSVVGLLDGDPDGLDEGDVLGLALGLAEGNALGLALGLLEGISVGLAEGCIEIVGVAEGDELGLSVSHGMGYQRASGLVREKPLAKICHRAF